MTGLGGLDIDGSMVTVTTPQEPVQLVSSGQEREPHPDEASDGAENAGASVTEPRSLTEAAPGFDRWPGGLAS